MSEFYHGLNIDILNPQGNPEPEQLKYLGVQRVRYTYHDKLWASSLDPAMVQLYTEKIKALLSVGIKSLLILTYDTLPGFPGYSAPDDKWYTYLDIFIVRVRQIAQKFGPMGVALQIWNEPDLIEPSGAYDPRLTPKRYSEMLDRACEVILDVSFATDVVSAGLASGNPLWWQEVYLGVNQPLDIVAIHPYTKQPTPNWPHEGWGTGYVGTLIEEYKKVWSGRMMISEIGLQTTNQAEQAEYLRRMFGTVKDIYHPPIEECHWFCYSSGMVPDYGLVTAGDQPTMSYDIYRQVAATPPKGHAPQEV